MGDFPLMVALADAPCLIVGAGAVALRKAKVLLPCGPRLTVVAPQILPEFQVLEEAEKLRLLRRTFRPEDIEGQLLVAAATGDPALNGRIAALCREQRILVNVADNQAACTCKFPAVVRRGGLTIGISTGGASPAAAHLFKERLEELLPAGDSEGMEEILTFLDRCRETVKARLPEKRRGAFFRALLDRCLAEGRGLGDLELEQLVEEAARDE